MGKKTDNWKGIYPLEKSSLSRLSPGPFIGPVEIRGKKNKKKYISFLPPVYWWGVEFRSKGLNFVPFRVSTNTHTRNYRRRHPFAMKLIANERKWNFSAGSLLKYLIIISFTLRALVIFNFFTQMDDSALIRKKRWSKMWESFHEWRLKDMFLASS